MSPASAAPPKDVPMNGFRHRTRHKDSKAQCPEVDLLINFLRSELLAMKDRLGWSYQTLAKKMGTIGEHDKYRNWRSLEVMLKTGGFPTMVKIARAMGLRVTVDIQ